MNRRIDKKVKNEYSSKWENPPDHYWNELLPLLPKGKRKLKKLTRYLYFGITGIVIIFTAWYMVQKDSYQRSDQGLVQDSVPQSRNSVGHNEYRKQENSLQPNEPYQNDRLSPNLPRINTEKNVHHSGENSQYSQPISNEPSDTAEALKDLNYIPFKGVLELKSIRSYPGSALSVVQIPILQDSILTSYLTYSSDKESDYDSLRVVTEIKPIPKYSGTEHRISVSVAGVHPINRSDPGLISGSGFQVKYHKGLNKRVSYFVGMQMLWDQNPGLIRNSIYRHYFLDRMQITQKLTIRNMAYAGTAIGVEMPIKRLTVGFYSSQMYLLFATSDLETIEQLPGESSTINKKTGKRTFYEGLNRFQPLGTFTVSYPLSGSLNAGISVSKSFTSLVNTDRFSEIPANNLYFIGANLSLTLNRK